MKKRNLVEMANCPKCKAVCLVGHDEDGQVFCAKCSASFRPVEIKSMETEKFNEEIVKKAKIEHKSGGWTAYTLN